MTFEGLYEMSAIHLPVLDQRFKFIDSSSRIVLTKPLLMQIKLLIMHLLLMVLLLPLLLILLLPSQHDLIHAGTTYATSLPDSSSSFSAIENQNCGDQEDIFQPSSFPHHPASMLSHYLN